MAMRPYYKPKLVNIAGLRATSERLPSPVEMNGTTSDFIEFSFDKYQIIIFPFYSPHTHAHTRTHIHTCTSLTYLARACKISCAVCEKVSLYG